MSKSKRLLPPHILSLYTCPLHSCSVNENHSFSGSYHKFLCQRLVVSLCMIYIVNTFVQQEPELFISSLLTMKCLTSLIWPIDTSLLNESQGLMLNQNTSSWPPLRSKY